MYTTGKQAQTGMALSTLLQVYFLAIIILQNALGYYLVKIINLISIIQIAF